MEQKPASILRGLSDALDDFPVGAKKPAAPADAVAKVAADLKFSTREPGPSQTEITPAAAAPQAAISTRPPASRLASAPPAAPVAPQPYRYRTDRHTQVGIKTDQETAALFKLWSERLNAPLGQVLTIALAALEKERGKDFDQG